MLTVSDLILSPIFSTVRLAAGKNGLSNIVLGTGILDWENINEIPQYFNAGEFVITNLANMKDDRKKAESCVKALIMNRASAVMIKDIYYDEISEELRQFAEEKHVPVFFFDKVYIDDMIHEVKKRLELVREVEEYESILDDIFNSPYLPPDEMNSLVDQINPYFHKKAFLTIYISDDEIMCSNEIQRLYQHMHSSYGFIEDIKKDDVDMVCSQLIYKRGILLIISFDTETEQKRCDYENYLIKRIIESSRFDGMRIGIGQRCPKEKFSIAVRSSVFANVNCVLRGCDFMRFNIVDGDYTIFSVAGEKEVQEYRDRIEEMLLRPAAKHMPLLETALAFAEWGGNVERTAEVLCQHKNTVRYRVERIREIFGAGNNMELYGRLYMFVKIYKAWPYLKMFFRSPVS
ncbi:MAG: PucR family transcriptional regulator [Anaerovoracaceae bacterium]